MDAKKTAFIGLGVMGFPMAGHLARAGHHVSVYNRTPAKALQWTEKHGGKSAPTPAAAATAAQFVMLCVGNDDDVRSVALAPEGALSGMKAGAILIDHTTASATIAREVYAAAKARGVRFLDAPVSGGQAGAENGKLTIMVGGDADAFALAEPVLACYARAVTLMGGPGAGQLTKMVNQISVAGGRQVRFRIRGRLDAQGPFHGDRGGSKQRRGAAHDGAHRPVLCAHPGTGRWALGYFEPHPPAARQGMRRRLQNYCAPQALCRFLARPSPYILRTVSGLAVGLRALGAARNVFETPSN